MRLASLTLISLLIFVVFGCASPQHQRVQALLQQPMSQLPNDQLLRGYYDRRREALELGATEAEFKGMSNQYSTNARIDRAFGARASANDNAGNAIATLIFAGIANAQRQAVVTKALEARVELEMRGWTPVLGFARSAPQSPPTVKYIERERSGPYDGSPVVPRAAVGQPIPASTPSETPPSAQSSATTTASAVQTEYVNASAPSIPISQPPCHQMVLGKDGNLRCGK
jgi:hypothetical protein